MHVRRSSRSTFNIEQVSIPVQSTSAFPCAGQHSDTDHTSSASMLLPPITLLGKHQAGLNLFNVEQVSISYPMIEQVSIRRLRNFCPSSHRSAFDI